MNRLFGIIFVSINNVKNIFLMNRIGRKQLAKLKKTALYTNINGEENHDALINY